MMTNSEYEVLKDVPGYKAILKAVLKRQIQYLVEQLARETEEETVVLSASISDGTLSHLGSLNGIDFLKDKDDIKFQFLKFCLKQKHHASQHGTKTPNSTVSFGRKTDEPSCSFDDDDIINATNSLWKATPEAVPVNIFQNKIISDEDFEERKMAYSNYINSAFSETLAVDQGNISEKITPSKKKRKRSFSAIPDFQKNKDNRANVSFEATASSATEPEHNPESDLNTDPTIETEMKKEPEVEENLERTQLEDSSIANDSLIEDLACMEKDKAFLTSLRDMLPYQEDMDKESYQILISEAEHLQLNPADIYKSRYRRLLNTPLEEGDRPFKCPLCSSRFKLRHHLTNHFSVHSGRGIYKCDLCPKSFTRKSTMKTHRKSHTVETSTYFHCEKCQTTFPHKDRLLYHKCPGITDAGHGGQVDNVQKTETVYVM